MTARRYRILTWHVHGSYLQVLGHVPHDIFVPVRTDRPPRYAGLPAGREWPANLREVRAEDVPAMGFDGVLYQSDENWHSDQHEILTRAQRRLPRIYLEHDPPGHDTGSCFDSRHPVDDPAVTIVHVTHFNDLMWDSGRNPTRVIQHAVVDRGDLYRGDLERGLVVVNNIARRGRRLGLDVYEQMRARIPLDLIGLGSEQVEGGLGEVPPDEVAAFAARYRFFFHPIRYTSLGMSLCEAVMAGIPVAALATTEATTVIEDGVTGYLSTDVDRLADRMRHLLDDPDAARRMGGAARQMARHRFGVGRFTSEWDRLIRQTMEGRRGRVSRTVDGVGSRVLRSPFSEESSDVEEI